MRFGSDASLIGEGLDVSEPELPERTNVVDLMAALKKSLGQVAQEKKPVAAKKKAATRVAPAKAPQAAAAKRKRV
jgi:DNA end-binding protein Ku